MNSQPLRVYVGTETEQLLTFQVLAHSIRRHASGPVDVIPLGEAIQRAGITIPAMRSSRTRQYTPFSFQRFAIPQLMGYEGRAIYLDSDQLVFKDIYGMLELAPQEADACAAKEPEGSDRSSQISVMVLNCKLLDWKVASIVEALETETLTYRKLYAELPIAPRFARALPHWWNDLERYTPGLTALTHFTDMETQPWLYAPHSLGKVWCTALFDAIEAGATTRDFIVEQVQKGWLRPSLAYQIDEKLADPAQLPGRVLRRDAFGFTPPHRVGILQKRWLRRIACGLTGYGDVHPGFGARMMRGMQALGYQAYRAVMGKRLLAH